MNNVLITGVSRGLGLELARHFVEKGMKVYGFLRNPNDKITALQKQYPDLLQLMNVDLSNSAGMVQTIKTSRLLLDNQFDGFVNNAAVAYDDLITNMSGDKLQEMYQVNVISPMLLVKYIIRNMLLYHTKGSIVHISSISAHTGYKGLGMYASTKGAIEAFSLNTAREWGERGIRSNCVVAGFMNTDMSAGLTHEQKQKIRNRTSLKTEVSVSSVADTVAFLLSDKSAQITGQNIFVDGGVI